MIPIMKTIISLLVSTLLIPAIASGEGLSDVEQQITLGVDRKIPHALELLERTANINSGTMNFEGVREVADAFAPEFEALGFTTRWVDGSEWGRAGHLIAERPGSGDGPHVLLIGHLDTVFELDSPFQEYEQIDEWTAKGPGLIDMKGGIVVMLLALGSVVEVDVSGFSELDRLQVTVILTGDEEKVGLPLDKARKDLREAAKRADIAIGFEDGDGDPATAVVARRGTSTWILQTSGTPAHSSQIFREDLGSGAIYEMARILSRFHDELGGEEFLTFNPGLVVGGTSITHDREQARGTAYGKFNVIAESTTVGGDLRALSPEQREKAKEKMRKIVDDHYPHTEAKIEFTDKYPPLAPTDGNKKLLSVFDQASQDLGFGSVEPVNPARAGAADVSFTSGEVEMAMDGVGLMGDGGHTVEETADLRTLPVQAKRVAVLLWRLADSEDRD
jgi:glutamate carboxypeptidase